MSEVDKEAETDIADQTSRSWFFLPTTSYVTTSEFAALLSDYHNSVEYFTYMGQLAHNADRIAQIARNALSNLPIGHRNDDDGPRAIEKYERFGATSVRQITNVLVDAFLWYISNMTQRVLLKRPQMLKTKEQIRIEEIVEFSSRSELVKFLVDRRVSRLAFGGLQEIETYLQDTLGIDLFSDNLQRDRVRFFVEVRNINAHNRGRANSLFLNRTAKFRMLACVEGEPIHLRTEVFILSEALIRAAMNFDKLCSEKFGIKRKKISSHISNKDIIREMDTHHIMHMQAALGMI